MCDAGVEAMKISRFAIETGQDSKDEKRINLDVLDKDEQGRILEKIFTRGIIRLGYSEIKTKEACSCKERRHI